MFTGQAKPFDSSTNGDDDDDGSNSKKNQVNSISPDFPRNSKHITKGIGTFFYTHTHISVKITYHELFNLMVRYFVFLLLLFLFGPLSFK